MARPKRNPQGLVAPPPSLSGEPGRRVAECVEAHLASRGNKQQGLLTLRFENGETGNLWVEVPSPLKAGCRYMRLTRIALGRAPEVGEPIDPGPVFEGKRFVVSVGYRKSKDAKGKGGLSEDFAQRCKDEHDFLRVHDLVELVRDSGYSPIDPYGTSYSYSNRNKDTYKAEIPTETVTVPW